MALVSLLIYVRATMGVKVWGDWPKMVKKRGQKEGKKCNFWQKSEVDVPYALFGITNLISIWNNES